MVGGIATIRLGDGTMVLAEIHWYEAHGIGRQELKGKDPSWVDAMISRSSRFRFALCVKNRGYRASLEVRKIYRAVDDRAAGARGLIRVVDESGDDYLYPSTFFVSVDVPEAAAKIFSKVPA